MLLDPGAVAPKLPYLNPIDYCIWPLVVQGTGQGWLSSVTALKQKVNVAWQNMDLLSLSEFPTLFAMLCRQKRVIFFTKIWPKLN